MKYHLLFPISLIAILLLSCRGGESEEMAETIRPVRFGKVLKIGGAETHTFFFFFK